MTLTPDQEVFGLFALGALAALLILFALAGLGHSLYRLVHPVGSSREHHQIQYFYDTAEGWELQTESNHHFWLPDPQHSIHFKIGDKLTVEGVDETNERWYLNGRLIWPRCQVKKT